ncbi:AraC family transcriptional regulator [Tanticharoenia sakaeratensis]|uniref:Transcriptional regulator protein n=1 Tax=Tanticharoenia sakaeratensis NBRC 103193 TaxID=1231623 RepID=A0A0D6MM08_9PROT|nr:AraC family transcriptional regulator [Tanticharoenia sakaeratensis]GAN54724.1 transcriptional regulator protein [Tanticharoenia sakaeratensis NBRC 103193]GBQ16916.1 AraC family transcriptional regulator [Tanticharoenia sakaeratensis NBRC 103193]
MDPLSDILALLKPESTIVGGFSAGGDWSVLFPAPSGIKCYAILSGSAWLVVDGVPEPARLHAGDCFLLPRGRDFTLCSDVSLTPVDYRSYLSPAGQTEERHGRMNAINGGGDFALIGGHFRLTAAHARTLLDILPPIVHLRDDADRAALRWSLDRMRQEVTAPQPGSALVIQHLADMMLIQALRLHLAQDAPNRTGWLFALADRQIGATIAAMHEIPARNWTVASLAAIANMSRTTFAQRFRQTVGTTPMTYLTNWRMLLATSRLRTLPVGTVALSLGYESESAFSTAFKRTMGCSPRQYGRPEAAA